MKTYQGVLRSYTITELSEKAKQKAYQNWLAIFEFYSGNEIEATLKEFCKIFDVHCYEWEYDTYNYDYSFDITNDTFEDTNLNGVRLTKYLWNNYAKYISEGKYYSLWSKFDKANNCVGKELKTRRSKVLTSLDDCPLTGVCYDIDILQPIIDCLTYKTVYQCYEELIDDCLDKFFKMAKDQYNYEQSMEYFEEESLINEYEYFEDGRRFYIPSGFKAIA